MDKHSVDRLIEERYQSLSPVLQRAARYVMDNPKYMALNSMRSVASSAGLQSSTMHRLARELGFDGYESFRSVYRTWVTEGSSSFSERATALQKRSGSDEAEKLIRELLHADGAHLTQLTEPDMLASIKNACDILGKVRRIYVAGQRSLFPAAFYFNYACGMFMHNTRLLMGIAGTFSDDLREGGSEDALLVFSYNPYARDSVAAVEFARQQGMQIVSVTDSTLSPIAKQSHALVVVPNKTPSLFPSVVPAMSVAQILVAMLVARGGKKSLQEIKKSEAQLQRFAVYVE